MKIITTLFLALFPSCSLFSQVPLTTSDNTLRHGDILCKIAVPYVEAGDRGSDAVWYLPEIPEKGKEHLQTINSNTDTIAVYEEGRILHYLAKGDTLLLAGAYAFKGYTSKLTEISEGRLQNAINEEANSLTSQQNRGVNIGSNTSNSKLTKSQMLNKAKAVATKNLEEESKTLGAEIKSLGYIDPCANVLSYKLQDWLNNE